MKKYQEYSREGLINEIESLHKNNDLLEKRLNIIFESAPDAYFISDLKGYFVDGNKASEKLIGYKKEELIGKSFLKLKLIPRKQILLAAKLLAKNAIGQPTGPDTFTLNRKDGKKVIIEISTHPVNFENKKLVLNIARDITDRILAEEILRDSEEKFRTIFNNLGVGIGMVSLEGDILLANERFSEITGYSISELLLKTNAGITHPDDQNETKENMKLLAQGKIKSFRLQKRLLHKNGTIVWIDMSVTPKFNIEGKIESVLGVLQDITESKLMENELQQLSASVEQSPVSTIITDLEGRIEYVNPSFCKLTGYTSENIIGENSRLLKSGKQPDSFYKDLWETISRGEIWKGEFHNKKKNGELFWEKATIGPIYNKMGKIAHFVALKENISQQKAAEEELKKSELKFRSLINQAAESMFLFNMKGQILDINPSSCNNLGFSREELLNKNISDIDPEVIPMKHREVFWSQVKPDKPVSLEGTHRRKDGSTYPVEVHISLIDHSDERILLGFVRDITERKKNESKIKKYQAGLEELVKDRTIELEKTNQNLNKRIEELQHYNELFVGREFRIKDLKEQIRKLKEEIKDS